MKKLFDIYQTWTLPNLLLFLLGVRLVVETVNLFGLVFAVVLALAILLFSLVTMILCFLCTVCAWVVPRPWAIRSIGIAALLSVIMIGTMLLSMVADMSWFIGVIRAGGYISIGALSLGLYAYDRFLCAREASQQRSTRR